MAEFDQWSTPDDTITALEPLFGCIIIVIDCCFGYMDRKASGKATYH